MSFKENHNLSIAIFFDNDYFLTGDVLKGVLELNVKDEINLSLREICVELAGFEEISFQKANASKVFFSTKMYFQGPRIKPSAAVRGPPECDGFWNAVKGKTLFNFSFKLPQNVPSSFSLMNNGANVKYVVTGNVQYHQDNIYDTLYTTKEACVIENIEQESMSAVPVRASTKKKMSLGRGGDVRLEGIASKSYFCSGKSAEIEVHVTNETKHKLHGLKANLYRSIIIPGTVTKKDNKSITKSISDINLKSNQYVFNPYEEKSVFIQIPIPDNNISMKNTSLFIVQYYITLSLNSGMFSKNISINLPISICHSQLYNCINNSMVMIPEYNKKEYSIMSTDIAPKKTFLNNLRSLSRKASLLKNKALLSKLCISDNDDYKTDFPKYRGSSRLSEVNFPSNYETIKRQNDMHMKNRNNSSSVEDRTYYYTSNTNENDYTSSYSIDTTSDMNAINTMNINYNKNNNNISNTSEGYYSNYNAMETEPDNNNPSSNSYTSYDDTNTSNSYLQNDSRYNQSKDDMDEDTSESEVTEAENAYNSDIDKFSKYFSNKKVFRSLSADNNRSYSNDNSNDANASKVNNTLSYSKSNNYGHDYRSPAYDTSSIKSKDSNQSLKNSANTYRNLSQSAIHLKPKMSSSTLKKVTSIEGINEEDEENAGFSKAPNTTLDYENNTTFFRNISSPYMQPNENSYHIMQSSRVLNTSRSNLSLSNNDYSYSTSYDNINIYNEPSEMENTVISTKNSILSSNYNSRTVNRNNSFQSNTSFSHRKAEDNSSISSVGSCTRYHNKSFENRGNEAHPVPHHNKSSPLHTVNHSTSFNKSYYNEVNMNNINFNQISLNNSNNNVINNNNNNNINYNSNNYNSNNDDINNNSSFSYQSPRSLPSSSPSTPPFTKKHFNNNGNTGHSYSFSQNFDPNSPLTPTIKHNFSLKSSLSVDGFLNNHRHSNNNNNHNPNTSLTTFYNGSPNNNKYGITSSYLKQSQLQSPMNTSPIDKSKNDKQSNGSSHYQSPSYSTPPAINPSSPYTIPTLENYINQFQRRPSLKYR